MDISISTPALLFSAISLLMLAFTNRFLSLASLARDLRTQWEAERSANLQAQLRNLRKRIRILRSTQAFGVLSFALCVASMFLILLNLDLAARWVFAISLGLMLVSLVLSLWEILISVRALEIELSDCENDGPEGSCRDE